MLSKTKKSKATNIYEMNDNVVFITTTGNLISIDLYMCSVLIHYVLPVNILNYFQDISKLNRDDLLSFSILYTTKSSIFSLKKILTF